MSRDAISLRLLENAVNAIEQTMHHVLGDESDIAFTSSTDLLPLSPNEAERVRNDETACYRARPTQAALHFCLTSSMAMLAICHSLVDQPPNQSPSERERRWKKLASDAKTAGRAAYRAALVLSDPAANESLGAGEGSVSVGRGKESKE